jgi:hypothetical protein
MSLTTDDGSDLESQSTSLVNTGLISIQKHLCKLTGSGGFARLTEYREFDLMTTQAIVC